MAETKSGTAGYFRGDTSAALGTIVAPASNTKGIRVTAISLYMPVNDQIRVMIKQTAPTSAVDAAAVTLAMKSINAGIATAMPVVIPPGWGLYEQCSVASVAQVHVAYEVLT